MYPKPFSVIFNSWNKYPSNLISLNGLKLNDTKVILCTDAGHVSDEIKNYNIKDDRGFVITQSLKKLKDEYKKQVFNKSDWRLPGD